jgi:hypothetical protein
MLTAIGLGTYDAYVTNGLLALANLHCYSSFSHIGENFWCIYIDGTAKGNDQSRFC